MTDELKKKLDAITKSAKFIVRRVTEEEVESLKKRGNDSWCMHNRRQVTWSQRPCGQWVIFVL